MEEKEFTLIELLSKLLKFINVFKQKFWKLLLFAFIGSSIFLGSAFLAKKNYVAVSTIFLKTSDPASASMLAGLASQFGFGGLGGGEIDEDKFLAIGVSKSVILKTLVNPIELRNKSDLLINFVIDELELNKSWDESDYLREFKIESKDINDFTYLEDSVFFEVFEILLEEHLTLSASKEGIISASSKFTDEKLSKVLNSLWVSSMSNYFVEKNIRKSKNEVNLLAEKVDSLYNLLKIKEVELAQVKDSKTKIIKYQGYVDEFRLRREVEMLSLMFGEVVKNLEIAKFTLRSQTPIVELIDRPRLPLEEVKPSKLKMLILGGFLGGIIGLIILIVIPLIKSELRKLENGS